MLPSHHLYVPYVKTAVYVAARHAIVSVSVCLCAGSLVHKLLPFIRKNKPAMVRLGSDMRYSEIMQEVNRDAATVATLLLTATVVVCLKAARIL